MPGRFATLRILAFALLIAPVWAGPSVGDDRVLRIQDGDSTRSFTVPELTEAVGLTELRIADDPYLGPARVLAGFALEPLLDHVGLGDAAELLLVCSDGYSIPFERSVMSKPGLSGLLAIRDTTLPPDAEANWVPFRHGTELISFDPFYLVWASTDPSTDLSPETLPWPFQLTEIRRFDRWAYFASAEPPEAAGEAARAGFDTYVDHCGKCHRMRGVGGELGPELDRPASLSSLLPTEQLRVYVRHDEHDFPQSKMPDFARILSPAQIDQLVAYLQAMQPAR